MSGNQTAGFALLIELSERELQQQFLRSGVLKTFFINTQLAGQPLEVRIEPSNLRLDLRTPFVAGVRLLIDFDATVDTGATGARQVLGTLAFAAELLT